MLNRHYSSSLGITDSKPYIRIGLWFVIPLWWTSRAFFRSVFSPNFNHIFFDKISCNHRTPICVKSAKKFQCWHVTVQTVSLQHIQKESGICVRYIQFYCYILRCGPVSLLRQRYIMMAEMLSTCGSVSHLVYLVFLEVFYFQWMVLLFRQLSVLFCHPVHFANPMLF